ncbi:hypothetical protein MKX01_006787 [Papaver californicum]|nr:hypothetical protein MKX01_006787 [Papaver californicum]
MRIYEFTSSMVQSILISRKLSLSGDRKRLIWRTFCADIQNSSYCASLVKQVATATNTTAGDGTTCATVLTQEILTEGCKSVAAAHQKKLPRIGGNHFRKQ